MNLIITQEVSTFDSLLDLLHKHHETFYIVRFRFVKMNESLKTLVLLTATGQAKMVG